MVLVGRVGLGAGRGRADIITTRPTLVITLRTHARTSNHKLLYLLRRRQVPLGGFAELQGMHGPQKFHVQRISGGPHRLPSAHTCINLLDLPQ